MRFVCKDFKRDLANVNFRTESNSKVLNDGFNRLIEFHAVPRCLHDPLFMLRVFMPRFRLELYFGKLEREGAWTDR